MLQNTRGAERGDITEPLNIELSGNHTPRRKRCRPPVVDALLLAASIVGIALIFEKIVPRWFALREKEAQEQSEPDNILGELALATIPLVASSFIAGVTSRGVIHRLTNTAGPGTCNRRNCALTMLAYLALCGVFLGSHLAFAARNNSRFFPDVDANAIQLRRDLGVAGLTVTTFLLGFLARGGMPNCHSSTAARPSI